MREVHLVVDDSTGPLFDLSWRHGKLFVTYARPGFENVPTRLANKGWIMYVGESYGCKTVLPSNPDLLEAFGEFMECSPGALGVKTVLTTVIGYHHRVGRYDPARYYCVDCELLVREHATYLGPGRPVGPEEKHACCYGNGHHGHRALYWIAGLGGGPCDGWFGRFRPEGLTQEERALFTRLERDFLPGWGALTAFAGETALEAFFLGCGTTRHHATKLTRMVYDSYVDKDHRGYLRRA